MIVPSLGKRMICLVMCLVCLMPLVLPVSAVEAEPQRLTSAVHYRASRSSLVIGCLEDGTELTVLGSSGDFYRIDCYDMTGYIAKSQTVRKDDKYYVNCDAEDEETRFFSTRSLSDAMTLRSGVYETGMAQLGVRYRSAGKSPRGFDCSGFVSYVFGQYGIEIGGSCEMLLKEGTVISQEDLQFGDLVFYKNTSRRSSITTHVAIYIGDGKILHAQTKSGISVTDMDAEYYASRYLCARRIILSDVIAPEQVKTVTAAAPAAEEPVWIQTRGIIIN